ncbi:MAG: 3-deoxy-7-phosphoheptulonate synthase [Chloroflexi bacterium]|nr:3-deoxy-7-phosphoheptulonate synthase [Chloroflexota bacterium]|tara:strand:- start:37313 stop:38353 length:1041 start_codon:yes stop_codon:yes gene_type:complete
MTNITNINIRELSKLPSPEFYQKKYPSSEQQTSLVRDSRETIEKIIEGKDNRLLLLVGPCSIHDTKAGIEYAEKLKELSDKVSENIFIVMRVYFEKPRTTVGWKGLINDPDLNGSFNIPKGIEIGREFLSEITSIGLPTATEFLDPFTPQYIGDLVSWGAIGARTAESQTHRQMASGLSMPIGFKNGTGGSVQLAIDGMIACNGEHAFLGIDDDGKTSIVITKGNKANHVILRGGASGTNYDKDSINEAQELLKKNNLVPNIVVDCSHGNSNKDHNRQPIVFKEVIEQRLDGNDKIIGIMLESNINPGNQSLGDIDDLEYGVSITDKCVGWEKTEEIILEANNLLN